ncbi:MAG: cytochrome B [Candidatus Hydrogenedentota bacterium]|nr:MAG: cytochrome B [Candidatus Hydrogenedentota bacterium]
MKWIRNLYDWVLSWADTPYGGIALFIIAFAESSFFPIPPDVLLIALCLGNRDKWWQYGAICTAGSILGGMAGYAIGWGLWSSVDDLFFTYVPGFHHEAFDHVQQIYQEWDFWFVFVAAFTPLPYKVVTVTAGVFGLNFFAFVLATVIGRSARFFLVAFMLRMFGEPIRRFIDKWFNILTIVFVVLLVGGFYVFKVMLQ